MCNIEEFKRDLLKRWSIRKFRWNIETQNEKQTHWQVVLHDAEHEDDILFLVIATSQVDKKRLFITSRDLPPDSLVIVPVGASSHFPLETAFNCNDAQQYWVVQLYAEYMADHSIYRWNIEKPILDSIMNGIEISPMIAKNIKDKISPENPD